MLLSAVSVLVVAQSSSEIPEGLMNNPLYITRLVTFTYEREEIRVLYSATEALNVFTASRAYGVAVLQMIETYSLSNTAYNAGFCGFLSGVAAGYVLTGYNVVSLCNRILMFRGNIVDPSSVVNMLCCLETTSGFD